MMHKRPWACQIGLGFFLCVLWAVPAQGAAPDMGLELFERSVRPLLVETCQKCHGTKKQEGSLRLDSRAALLLGGDNGPAIVPGEPAKSLLLEALRQTGDLKMPPKSKLADDKIADIERWIQLGAPWPATAAASTRKPSALEHWAFQPVRDPKLPSGAVAKANPIDLFVEAKLNAAGLTAAPTADRRTLIRRATFDLTGLPPTPENVDAFVQSEDPRAYEKLIDRLLASPQYGEQWGRHWLDVARYADTKGYVYAREQRFWIHAWAYRDWVVKALNDDLPYDRFLLLQIAADQAAPDERSSLAAMGFLTLGRRFLGVTHDIIDDRIDVVTRGTMGLTVSCARCHDHKYDPIPTRDYYSLYAVFQNCAERLVPLADSTAQGDSLRAYQQELEKREQKLATTLLQRRQEAAARVRARVTDYLVAQLELHKYPEEGFDQLLAKDDIIPAFVRRWQLFLLDAQQRKESIFAPWLAFAAIDAKDFAAEAPQITAWLASRPAGEIHPLVLKQFAQPPQTMREVAQRYGELFASVEQQWQAAQKAATDAGQPPPASLPDSEMESLRGVLYGPGAPCEVPDEGIVDVESYFDLASCEELWRIQSERDNWLIQSPVAPPHAVMLADRTPLRPAWVFKRGRPANKGELAPRQFLELLAGAERKPFELGSGRLELAQAIIDPRNPLTARVMVNRVWLHHFGAGLVRTPSDFGTRAEPPSHPELLDWLTSRFLEDGWSLKQLHRRIMLSDAYRRSPLGPKNEAQLAKAVELDPENRLLWRANQRRLTFEELRDALFAVSGELDLGVGGKPSELFAASYKRRTLYGLIDRQFLPSTLRIFDFANPDLHIPQRSETTVPQQALFFLNDQLLIGRAQAIARRLPQELSPTKRVQHLYRQIYQREATSNQVAAALALVQGHKESEAAVSANANDWQYGFGAFDEQEQRTTGFQKLPHFTGNAWQGGPAWPDPKLGWVRLTANGGHAGNDAQHAAVRRWTAPRDMQVNLRSLLMHPTAVGDGVRGRIISSRQGLLKTANVHDRQVELPVDALNVKAGETLDFSVDIHGTLNNDQFTWDVTITAAGDLKEAHAWDAKADFPTTSGPQLDPWEQLTQVLLSANEFVFVD